MWISKKKWQKTVQRIDILELELKNIKKELHPSAKDMKDAMWDVIRFHQQNQTFSNYHKDQ